MEFLAEGFRALERHWRIVATYTGVSLVLVMAIHTWQAAMLHEWLGPIDETTIRQIDLVIMLLGTAIGAGIQCVFFGFLGQAIDKPLFKLDGAMDALKRFFTMWLLLNMIMLAIGEVLEGFAIDEHPAASGIMFFLFIWYVFYIPIGACIMFHGAFHRKEIGDALAPMGRLFPQTAAVMLLRTFEFGLLVSFAPLVVPTLNNTTAWIAGAPALSAMLILLECVSFAAMWEICRVFRDIDDGDDEFDF